MKQDIMHIPRVTYLEGYEEIWLGGGCFWGTQELIRRIHGVVATAVGYSNGSVTNPTYAQVCTGLTGHAEVVSVLYDPLEVSLNFLLNLYYESVNPTSLNRQGGDIGTQYRTGIYYKNLKLLPIIEESISGLEKKLGKKTAIEVKELENFYLAESEHQDYLQKNPQGYCHLPTSLFTKASVAKEFIVPTQKELKERLTETEYKVTQKGSTEPPFSNEYYNNVAAGLYVDITTGEPLFSSKDQYDAGCGWPAFSRPLSPRKMKESLDTSLEYQRTEVRSSNSDAHLGHLFKDGPKELGGLRYCINSAALKFIPIEKMEEAGYKAYISYVI